MDDEEEGVIMSPMSASPLLYSFSIEIDLQMQAMILVTYKSVRASRNSSTRWSCH